MQEALKETQKRYQDKNPVIRIDNDTYIWIKNFSEDNKIAIKNTIKMAIEDFKENEHIKQENDLLKREVERLRIENDLLKGKEKKGLREGLKGLIFK